VRLTICVPETDVVQWYTSRDLVLRGLASQLEDRDHVVVSSGTFVDFPKLRNDWLVDDEQVRVATAQSGVDIGLFHLGGIPSAKVDRVRRSVAEAVPEAFGATIVAPSERRVLMHLEHTLPLRYRLVGNHVRVLHEMQELQEDLAEPEYQAGRLRELGCFDSVELEDIGLQDTVFDDVNFGRAFLRRVELAGWLPDPWQSEAVCTWLVTVDPRLNDTLHAAVERAVTAETPEQVAQAALSCRRYLEQLANALFPPSDQVVGGRRVGAAEWKNRLWAALELRIGPGAQSQELTRLGRRLDDIKRRADVGVHHNPGLSQEDLAMIISDVISFSDEVRGLRPPGLTAPLGPYTAAVQRFLEDLLPEGTED
jgi:hypothetical protein